MQKNSYHMREYAFVCVYGHIMRANMHIYAKYNIKKFCKTLDAHAYARYNKYILD